MIEFNLLRSPLRSLTLASAKRFQEGEYKNLSQFMFGGEIHNIRFKYFGPSVEAVLDKLPNAEIESAAEITL